MRSNRLNHFPEGTSGRESSQSVICLSCSAVICRYWTRSSRCSYKATGRLRRSTFGIALLAVEAACHCGAQADDLRRIGGGSQLLGEACQFVSGKLTSLREFKRKANHLQLFRRGQLLDLLYNRARAHSATLTDLSGIGKVSRGGSSGVKSFGHPPPDFLQRIRNASRPMASPTRRAGSATSGSRFVTTGLCTGSFNLS